MSQVLFPLFLALVKPHPESCAQFLALCTKETWTFWRAIIEGLMIKGQEHPSYEESLRDLEFFQVGKRRLGVTLSKYVNT